MMSYLSENETENQQHSKVHFAEIPDIEMEYLNNISFGTLKSLMDCFLQFA